MYLQSSLLVNIFMKLPAVVFRVDNYILVCMGINGLRGTAAFIFRVEAETHSWELRGMIHRRDSIYLPNVNLLISPTYGLRHIVAVT
jgi:hypothetical protein